MFVVTFVFGAVVNVLFRKGGVVMVVVRVLARDVFRVVVRIVNNTQRERERKR